MSVDIPQKHEHSSDQSAAADDAQPTPRPSIAERLYEGFTAVEWPRTLLVAAAMAIGWCLLFLSNSILQVLAGIVPVTAGLYLGRQVKHHLAMHGFMLGILGYTFGAGLVAIYSAMIHAGIVAPLLLPTDSGAPVVVGPLELMVFYLSFSALAMIPFPAFGAIMSGRAEQRQQEMREQTELRGGRLEKPNVVRTLEDLQGLSLPQFGTYVNNVFKKNGFTFKDYRFLGKDKHLDLELEYQDETYLLRLSVVLDRVPRGVLESLVQDMRRRDIPKGLVITSTEFANDVSKAAKGRTNITIIDGQTLFDIAEG